MKAFLKSFFSPLWNSKIAVALALSLVLVGAAVFFWGGVTERALGENCNPFQCGDCVDNNDGDGLIDFNRQGRVADVDPDCESATDDSESPVGGGGGGPGGGPGLGSNSPLCGFAWGATDEAPSPSKMGVGWVSFNSKDCDTNGNNRFDDGVPGCPTSGTVFPYAVSVDKNGNLVGYAWSSNIYWIKFGGLGDPPNTSGNNEDDAKISGSGSVSGWARAIVAVGRNDGWDGWISLRGNLSGSQGLPGSSGSDYGINFNQSTRKFSGFSWGSEVVGWLKWDQASGNGVRYCDAQNLIALLTADPVEGTVPFDSTLTATSRVALESQRQLAQVADLYRFDCGLGEGWGESQLLNFHTCTYDVSGWFYPRVEIKSGGLDAIGTVEIHAKPAAGNLGAECTVSPAPLLINQEATWTAGISPQGVTTLPYVYTFTFDDDLDGDFDDFSANVSKGDTSPATVARTYSILGKKSVRVSVTDSSSPANTGICEESTGVIVRPKIIEI